MFKVPLDPENNFEKQDIIATFDHIYNPRVEMVVDTWFNGEFDRAVNHKNQPTSQEDVQAFFTQRVQAHFNACVNASLRKVITSVYPNVQVETGQGVVSSQYLSDQERLSKIQNLIQINPQTGELELVPSAGSPSELNQEYVKFYNDFLSQAVSAGLIFRKWIVFRGRVLESFNKHLFSNYGGANAPQVN